MWTRNLKELNRGLSKFGNPTEKGKGKSSEVGNRNIYNNSKYFVIYGILTTLTLLNVNAVAPRLVVIFQYLWSTCNYVMQYVRNENTETS